ncbi:hypothetical protein EIN_080740 [Entamoeba invadens IP1]|uniref:hypothetical protein n=1 Tax=Entamoeba invadens IP1 TaxID=370355 RepID=UPI0002C3D38D|nr:hypothetical protein EIN_080740 [Entamoeba invadens IP1]ELP85102.1 hypothetical protein EIN_080740 [Entamoeba invadens IP1]|eukprot:XP_004184448.1 hypothetical protein EIN_080740 [Entamoeba invadens IP1]
MTKRESTNREHVSNAAIIGIANLYGVSFMLKCPISKTKTFVVEDHITIAKTSLYDKVVVSDCKKSEDALLLNVVSDFLINTQKLSFKLRKARRATKTIKLSKYECIDPFNETGFTSFGKGVITIIRSLPKVSFSKKQETASLDAFNEQIFSLYSMSVLDINNLSSNGQREFGTMRVTSTVTPSIPQDQVHSYEQQNVNEVYKNKRDTIESNGNSDLNIHHNGCVSSPNGCYFYYNADGVLCCNVSYIVVPLECGNTNV